MKETYYKVLKPDRKTIHANGQWPMPGKWLEAEGDLIPCANGLHLCRRGDLIQWLGPEIWTAEYEGERVDSNDKIVVRKARLIKRLDTWNERTQRLFACDCAEHVLHFFESKFPGDDRPRKVIETTRLYAVGEASLPELRLAARATRDAASAAWAARAARAAGSSGAEWDAAEAAAEAAWSAARVAGASEAAWAARGAGDSARSAAWATSRGTWGAEIEWQTDKLFEYLKD